MKRRRTYQEIPGTVTMSVEAFQAGDSRFEQEVDGRLIRKGTQLARLRDLFGGRDEGQIRDPYHGDYFLISLKQWADADPDNTYIHVSFQFIPDDPIPADQDPGLEGLLPPQDSTDSAPSTDNTCS